MIAYHPTGAVSPAPSTDSAARSEQRRQVIDIFRNLTIRDGSGTESTGRAVRVGLEMNRNPTRSEPRQPSKRHRCPGAGRRAVPARVEVGSQVDPGRATSTSSTHRDYSPHWINSEETPRDTKHRPAVRRLRSHRSDAS